MYPCAYSTSANVHMLTNRPTPAAEWLRKLLYPRTALGKCMRGSPALCAITCASTFGGTCVATCRTTSSHHTLYVTLKRIFTNCLGDHICEQTPSTPSPPPPTALSNTHRTTACLSICTSSFLPLVESAGVTCMGGGVLCSMCTKLLCMQQMCMQHVLHVNVASVRLAG